MRSAHHHFGMQVMRQIIQAIHFARAFFSPKSKAARIADEMFLIGKDYFGPSKKEINESCKPSKSRV